MRKVLIITYYWPPAGGPGVQRWLKFVKYLRDFGIDPVIYIPENPNYPIQDVSLSVEIPDGIKIYKSRISEPYAMAQLLSSKKTKRISSGVIQTKNQSFLEKVMLWVRGNFYIPDARKNWVKPSVKYLTKILEKENIDTIITSGPPHSLHLIGNELKQKLKVQWLADFRDPWTSIGYHKKLKLTSSSKAKHKRLEKMVLTNADKIIVTSQTTKDEFKTITEKPIKVITNGFDGSVDESIVLDSKFTISHIGSLLTGRNPENLWKVLSELIQENSDFRNSFQLQLIGLTSKDVLETINGHGLEPFTELMGYVSHDDAISLQQKSQVLLLVEIDSVETKGIIPGKLFEYILSKRPILAVGPKEWEVSDIVAQTRAGRTFDYQSEDELKTVLLEWFKLYQDEKLIATSIGIEKYSRKELTRELTEFIEWESF